MQTDRIEPHYGGQIGLVALLCMLTVTGCVTFAAPGGSSGFLPGWAQRAPIDAGQITPIQAVQIRASAATFIVRFDDEPELEQVCRNFRRDETGTRRVYQAWAARYPQLEGLRLERASYSGELILALPVDDPAGRSPYDVISALETIDNLAYAEIDEMASASSGR